MPRDSRNEYSHGARGNSSVPPEADGEGVRLQKVLAQAGVASRRGSEELIATGRVSVNGTVVREQGTRVDPATAVIHVDGTRIIAPKTDSVYLALNKPKGMHSTMSDDMGRRCIGDLLADRIYAGQRLFHVGRLDAETEGLILITGDGELAHRLMHPSFEVSKTYIATVAGTATRELGKRLRTGIELEDGLAQADTAALLDVFAGESMIKLTLHSGRKRVVRRMLAEAGFPVKQLVRTDFGPVALGDQRPGSLRVLGRGEVGALHELVDL